MTRSSAEARLDAARLAVIGYLRNNPGDFSPVVDITKRSGAYPTPRSWESAAKVLARIPNANMPLRRLVMEGFVGKEAAARFVTWEKEADLPNPADVLADPTSFDFADKRDSRVYVVLRGVTASATRGRVTQTVIDALWEVYGAAVVAGRIDMVVSVAGHAIQAASAANLTIPVNKKLNAKISALFDPAKKAA